MIHGIINVYKEKGYTSHDVVAKLRGILHQKKIGHTGTLDPEAEGVLPVCLGKATKLCDMLTEKDKVYRAGLLLGMTTDTQDATGRILETKAVDKEVKEVYEAIMSFVGEYEQIPPMYSAKKVNGKKLYELAREGKVVERKAASVVIHDINIHGMDLPRVVMTVACSKGTYIRTLCHDIGQKLGCGACMESLFRTQSGRFQAEDSLKLQEIQVLAELGQLEEHIIPIDAMFEDYPAVQVSEEGQRFLDNGNTFYKRQLQDSDELREDTMVRVYGMSGEFYAVYQYLHKENRLKPVKMFYDRGQ